MAEDLRTSKPLMVTYKPLKRFSHSAKATSTFSLNSPEGGGLVLKIDINKSRDVKNASDGIVYVRRGAQNLPYSSEAELTRLRRNKGLVSFETETIAADPALLTN